MTARVTSSSEALGGSRWPLITIGASTEDRGLAGSSAATARQQRTVTQADSALNPRPVNIPWQVRRLMAKRLKSAPKMARILAKD
jgi:hypothetical protein